MSSLVELTFWETNFGGRQRWQVIEKKEIQHHQVMLQSVASQNSAFRGKKITCPGARDK